MCEQQIDIKIVMVFATQSFILKACRDGVWYFSLVAVGLIGFLNMQH